MMKYTRTDLNTDTHLTLRESEDARERLHNQPTNAIKEIRTVRRLSSTAVLSTSRLQVSLTACTSTTVLVPPVLVPVVVYCGDRYTVQVQVLEYSKPYSSTVHGKYNVSYFTYL